jgi:integrase/recombinase XerD
MKSKVFLKRFYHRDKLCIGIFFGYEEKLKAAVKSIANVAWSNTNKCFYLDDNEDNIKLILRSLKDFADIDISAISGSDRIPGPVTVQDMVTGMVQGNLSGNKLLNDPDVSPVKDPLLAPGEITQEDGGIISLRSLVDDMSQVIVPVKEKEILPDRRKINPVITGKRRGPVEFTIKEKDALLVIRFPNGYDSSWIAEMKSYGHLRYDEKRGEWLLAWTKLTCDSLADYFATRGVDVTVSRQVIAADVKERRQEIGDRIRGRVLGQKAVDALEQLKDHLGDNRYSVRTLKSYLPLLELFFKYYNTIDPEDITEKQVSSFVHDFIIGNGYSSSYQNQVVSAIKTWYEISGTGRIDPVFLERPRRGRPLPKVFSKDEVRRILNAARNGKHKLLLWMVYSCGLRRSEVINIRLSDLDRDRGILHIREGKGNVDRIVPVSEKVWEKIDEYIDGYTPANYLFEGSRGGKYSAESVYQVFKQSLKRAGIKKDVGIHSLRHSYATHLHESGLDIRYIQELLGHRSTKTTEIYTHVSRRNLVAVRSPIEDLDVK